MSSDGAMDKPRSARPARGDDRGLASIALGVLLVLALIATVVMIFSDNPVWMRIGTLSALWAAFIGAFLVARYRRQAAAEAARVRDLHTVYELQLEREISARREHELVVEKELRASVRAETEDSVLALRQEIAALREQLTALGVSLPEDRFAVGGLGPAGQLGPGSSLPSVPSERVAPRRRTPGMTPPRVGARTSADSEPSTEKTTADRPGQSAPFPRSTPSGRPSSSAEPSVAGVGPDATPSTERTERLSPVAGRGAAADSPTGEPRRPAVRPVAGTQEPHRTPDAGRARPAGQPPRAPSPNGPAAAPETESKPASQTESKRESAPKSESTSGSRRSSEPAPESASETPSQPASESAPASRHGEGRGLSVAELMARLGEGDAPRPSRRRRRAED
ncbi:hypothetical protein AYJ66_02280 [Dietzia cinnamea]|nr:hypothetical protein AYJ66_02280 [Dietzia cinnamea]